MNQPITQKNFVCDMCGKCCLKLSAEVSKEKIKKIKKLGYKEEEFLNEHLLEINKIFLKNENGCFFLEKQKDNKYHCKIHKNRPKICRQYPFFGNNEIKSCLPKDMFPKAFVPLKRNK